MDREPSLLKNFGGSNLSLFYAFRLRHHVHSTVVRPFCKIGEVGNTLWNLYNLVTIGPSASSGYAHVGQSLISWQDWCFTCRQGKRKPFM